MDVSTIFEDDEPRQKLPSLDLSGSDNREQRDISHATQDLPKVVGIDNCDTPLTSTPNQPISSQVQRSIASFTSDGDVSKRSHDSHLDNEPAIEQISRKLEEN